MKKTLFFCLVIVLLAAFLCACGSRPSPQKGQTTTTYSVEIDGKTYYADSEEEIDQIIQNHLWDDSSEATATQSKEEIHIDASAGDVVIYDKDGLYIEYRGLVQASDKKAQLSLYFDNMTGEDLFISLDNLRLNRNNFSAGNTAIELLDDTSYLVGPNYNNVIDIDDLKAYGITSIESVAFELEVHTGGWAGKDVLFLSVSADDMYAVNW